MKSYHIVEVWIDYTLTFCTQLVLIRNCFITISHTTTGSKNLKRIISMGATLPNHIINLNRIITLHAPNHNHIIRIDNWIDFLLATGLTSSWQLVEAYTRDWINPLNDCLRRYTV